MSFMKNSRLPLRVAERRAGRERSDVAGKSGFRQFSSPVCAFKAA